MTHYAVIDTNVIVSASDKAVHCDGTTDDWHLRWRRVIQAKTRIPSTAPYMRDQM